MTHWSLLYRAQDSLWQVAQQSPPVDGQTRLCHHSHPHSGILGTTRPSILREMIYALTAEQEWLVRRGPGIGSHTGRRVRNGHLKHTQVRRHTQYMQTGKPSKCEIKNVHTRNSHFKNCRFLTHPISHTVSTLVTFQNLQPPLSALLKKKGGGGNDM